MTRLKLNYCKIFFRTVLTLGLFWNTWTIKKYYLQSCFAVTDRKYIAFLRGFEWIQMFRDKVVMTAKYPMSFIFIIKFKFHEDLIHVSWVFPMSKKIKLCKIKTRSRNREELLFDKNLNIQMIHFQLSTRNFRCVILNDHHWSVTGNPGSIRLLTHNQHNWIDEHCKYIP